MMKKKNFQLIFDSKQLLSSVSSLKIDSFRDRRLMEFFLVDSYILVEDYFFFQLIFDSKQLLSALLSLEIR